jgi:hypothetical protein
MKNSVNKLPQKKAQTLYHFKKTNNNGLFDTTTQSQGDPTNTCTTIFTTTHFM